MALTAIPTDRLAAALRDGEEASASELLALVSTRDVRIRESLAARDDAPLTALLHLAQDSKSSVRIAVAANPAIADAGSLLALLASDRDADVVQALATNRAIAPERLAVLATHGKKRVREAVQNRLQGR